MCMEGLKASALSDSDVHGERAITKVGDFQNPPHQVHLVYPHSEPNQA